MRDIDWSKAPEGATHYDTSPDVYPWLKKDNNGNKYWHLDKWVYYSENIDESEDIIPRPEPKPVYTQAMKDNGELPSIGMKVLASHGNEGEVKLMPDADGRWVVEIDSQYCIYALSELFPIAPPVELIDKGIYSFELCFGDYLVGYYHENRKSFFDKLSGGNKICGKTEASNITLLTPDN